MTTATELAAQVSNDALQARRFAGAAQQSAIAAQTKAQEVAQLVQTAASNLARLINTTDAAQQSAIAAQQALSAIEALVETIGSPDVAVALKVELGTAAYRNVGATPGTVAAGDDSRFTDARTPTGHSATHQTGGADELTATDVGADPAGTAAAATLKAPVQIATSRALTNADHNKVLVCATGVSLTINTGLTAGFSCGVKQGGTTQVEIIAGAGVTRVNLNDQFKTSEQKAIIGVVNTDTETYDVTGATAA